MTNDTTPPASSTSVGTISELTGMAFQIARSGRTANRLGIAIVATPPVGLKLSTGANAAMTVIATLSPSARIAVGRHLPVPSVPDGKSIIRARNPPNVA